MNRRTVLIRRGDLNAENGLQLELSDHAIERFRERVRPGLMRRAAEGELIRLVREHGYYSRTAPDWWVCEDDAPYAVPFAFVVLGPDVVLTVRHGSATSCIVKGTPSDLARVAKRQRRAAEARGAAASRGGGRPGKGGKRKDVFRAGAGGRKARRGEA